jgi:Subtilase family
MKWTIDNEVDIISLSLTLFEDLDALDDVLSAAKQKDIVVLCATADQGNNQRYTKLANNGNAFTVAACDSYGKDLNWTQGDGVNYKIHGKDIAVGPVPFINSKEVVSGSSVATAIGAGLASLVLSCCSLAGDERIAANKPWKRKTIEERFPRMNPTGQADVYVQPWFLAGRDKSGNSRITDEQSQTQTEDLINKNFGKNYAR